MPTKTEPVLLRFKRRQWRGGNSRDTEPLWHLAAAPYRRGEIYKSYVALCSYTIKNGLFADVVLTEASHPKGATCKKCMKKALNGEPAIGRVGRDAPLAWVEVKSGDS